MKIKKLGPDPCVWLTVEAKAKIDYLVKLASKEVGWLGKVQEYTDMQYVIEDIFLVKQEVTSAETELDDEALGTFFNEHFDDIEKFHYWGHSHVNMPVNPSGQDVKQITEFIVDKQTKTIKNEYFIMGIHNKSGQVRWDIYTPTIIYEEVESKLYYGEMGFEEELKAQFKELVSERTYATNTYNTWPNGRNNRSPQYPATSRSVHGKDDAGKNNRSDRLRGDRVKDSIEYDEAWDSEVAYLGRRHNRGAQHPKSGVLDTDDWTEEGWFN